jgi:hypothetical protein
MVRIGVRPSAMGVTALGVFSTVSFPALSDTSQAQPDPNWVAPAAAAAGTRAGTQGSAAAV